MKKKRLISIISVLLILFVLIPIYASMGEEPKTVTVFDMQNYITDLPVGKLSDAEFLIPGAALGTNWITTTGASISVVPGSHGLAFEIRDYGHHIESGAFPYTSRGINIMFQPSGSYMNPDTETVYTIDIYLSGVNTVIDIRSVNTPDTVSSHTLNGTLALTIQGTLSELTDIYGNGINIRSFNVFDDDYNIIGGVFNLENVVVTKLVCLSDISNADIDENYDDVICNEEDCCGKNCDFCNSDNFSVDLDLPDFFGFDCFFDFYEYGLFEDIDMFTTQTGPALINPINARNAGIFYDLAGTSLNFAPVSFTNIPQNNIESISEISIVYSNLLECSALFSIAVSIDDFRLNNGQGRSAFSEFRLELIETGNGIAWKPNTIISHRNIFNVSLSANESAITVISSTVGHGFITYRGVLHFTLGTTPVVGNVSATITWEISPVVSVSE